MFLQICLITAGIHIGRTLLQAWREPEEDTEPQGVLDADAPLTATTARPIVPEPPGLSPAEVASARRAEIEEQFNLAVLSTGLSSAAALFFPHLRLLAGVGVLYGGIPIMARAKQRLFDEHRVGAEVLDTVGMVTTLATEHYVASSFIFLIYAGSRKLHLMTERAAQESMVDAFGHRSELVWLLKDGVEVGVPLDSLVQGDVVVVDAGSPIPADGIVLSGHGLVDQHVLTGESQPQEKGIGDEIFAATVVFSGRLHIRVEITGKDTVAAELAEVLQRTADFTGSLEARGQQIADKMAPPTLALSALAYPVVGAHGSVALLNSSFLDNMRFFTPVSMLNHLRKAYGAGILIKDGRSLQVLPKVDTVVFDKTGTLTLGQLHVRRVYSVHDAGEEDDVLTCAAAAEHRQTHPIALAITDEVKRRGQSVPSIDETDYEVGYGLTARAGARSIRVGSKRFMVAHGIDIPASLSETETSSYDRGCSLVYVARDGALLGVIELEPTLRPEVEQVLGALRERGVSLCLMSGDHEAPTRTLAESLGFDRYFAGILPSDKAQTIDALQTQGRTVCFVGDGINDALALKKAAVSVSMGGASAAARDSAQIVMLGHGLGLLPRLFEIANDFESNLNHIMISLGAPAALGVTGVFFAGFRVHAVTSLYGMSMAASVAVAMWPRWKGVEDTAEPWRDPGSEDKAARGSLAVVPARP